MTITDYQRIVDLCDTRPKMSLYDKSLVASGGSMSVIDRVTQRLHRLVALCVLACAFGSAQAGDVVISQIYGGGGNAGAPYRQDFIELFNRSASPVDITGWSVQYAGAASASWQRILLPSGGEHAGQSCPHRWHRRCRFADPA